MMVEKRLKKGRIIEAEVVPPEFSGDNGADVLLVSWGSTHGSAVEAAEAVRARGKGAATLHFPQVWPLVPDAFLPRLRDAGEVVAVEGNATGQFARLLRRETGFEIEKRILRYDGLPMTPEYIVRGLESLGRA
jgi:2-oxoglutarate ferredoxin oxidoreductase subunit alpha